MPEGTEEIYSNAFYNCKRLTKVILPESVTTISESFYGCSNLQIITLPAQCKIAKSAFKRMQSPRGYLCTSQCISKLRAEASLGAMRKDRRTER